MANLAGRRDGETDAQWGARITALEEMREGVRSVRGSAGEEEDDIDFLTAYRISVRKALNDKDTSRAKKASDAVDAELDGLMEMNFGVGMMYSTMTREEKMSIIHAFMFMTEKKLGSGAFDKWKARLVAGGNELKDVIEADTYSPTANYTSVMTTIALAACEKKDVRSYDVKTAYLIPDIEEGEKPIFIRIDPVVTARLIERHSHLRPFLFFFF